MDREGFETLIRTHQAELYRYARYLGAAPAEAEDLVQETFLTSLQVALPPEAANLRVRAAWLRGVLRNLFLRHCRRVRRSPIRADSELLDRAEAVWKEEFLREGDGFDYLEALRKCLADQPERQRAVLEMQYRDRRSRAQIGAALKMTEDGVKSLLRRIRAALADCVRRRLLHEHA